MNGAAELDPLYANPGYSAQIVVRLVDKDKQTLWTAETSYGGAFFPVYADIASSKVVDRVIKDLTQAIETSKTK